MIHSLGFTTVRLTTFGLNKFNCYIPWNIIS